MTASDRPVFNDRYEIQQRIGRGGMADVFVARDRLLDRRNQRRVPDLIEQADRKHSPG